jgi:pyruvate formate lyase activating enzyme
MCLLQMDLYQKYLDAANIDLKGFSEDYYKKVCGARFEPVLKAIKKYHEQGVFIEITTLIVPGHNDNKMMLEKIANFIKGIDPNIPWHISRFYPNYKMQEIKPTSIDIIHKAVDIGKKIGLKYIYAGNIPGDSYENTYCPNCGKKVIERIGFSITNMHLKNNKCKYCMHNLNLILR